MEKLCISLIVHNFSDCEKSVSFIMDRDPNEVILSTDKGNRDTYFLLGKYPNYSLYLDGIYADRDMLYAIATGEIVKDLEKRHSTTYSIKEKTPKFETLLNTFNSLEDWIIKDKCYARNLYIELN